jgi:hypothetical protein
MNPLLLEATVKSPAISFDPTKMVFEISGESRPEHAAKFYEPVIQWLEALQRELVEQKKSESKATFLFKLSYFNSISAKFILDILKVFESFSSAKSVVTVHWYYDKRDEDMKESGEEFAPLVNLPFEFICQ